MKRIITMLIALFVLTSHVWGFATAITLIKGGDKINFNSNVDGVEVFMNDIKCGVLKNNYFEYSLDRDGKAKEFTFKKAGYEEVTLRLTKSLDPMFWGNIIIGGSIGSSIDSLSTKNAYSYSPSNFYIDMKKK